MNVAVPCATSSAYGTYASSKAVVTVIASTNSVSMDATSRDAVQILSVGRGCQHGRHQRGYSEFRDPVGSEMLSVRR